MINFAYRQRTTCFGAISPDLTVGSDELDKAMHFKIMVLALPRVKCLQFKPLTQKCDARSDQVKTQVRRWMGQIVDLTPRFTCPETL